MEQNKQVYQTDPDFNIEDFPSKTYAVKVGCDKAYITVAHKDGKIWLVLFHYNKDLKCARALFDYFSKATTFQSRRELDQTIKDLLRPDEDYACEEYGILTKKALKEHKLFGFTCGDAIARVLIKERDAIPQQKV
jgi:hypothetical protein